MHIIVALSTSLALHFGVLVLYSCEHSEGTYRGVQHNRAAHLGQEIRVRLTAPPEKNTQHLPPSPPIETSSNDLVSGSESIITAQESGVGGEPTSTDTGTQTPSAIPSRYFDRQEVDRPPRIIDSLDSTDGPLDRALTDFDVNGSIIIELWISKKGSVDRLNIVNTTLPDAVVRIIVAQTSLATFVPARLDHKAVPSRILIELSIREKPKTPPT